MKKIVVVAVYCMLCITVLNAQSDRFYVGVKSGLNIANLNAPNGSGYSAIPSFYAGGLAHIHITQQFAVQHELFLSGQGSKFGSDRMRLLYLNMPLLAQYMTNSGFRLETGPQVGFLLAAKNKNGNTETNFKDDFKPIDFSWAFGAGYLFPGTGFGLDARYNLGINNIHDAPGTFRNSVFSVGAFYQWQCKHSMERKH